MTVLFTFFHTTQNTVTLHVEEHKQTVSFSTSVDSFNISQLIKLSIQSACQRQTTHSIIG